MNNYVTILNCRFLNIGIRELLETYNEGVLITPNVDHLVKMQKDRDFYAVNRSVKYCVNDSQIVLFAARFLGVPLKETISGSDFFPQFYNYHKNNTEVTIFLLGAAEGVAQKAMERINAHVGRTMVTGCYSPPFGFENDLKECERIVAMVNQSRATVLAVGLGAPKQEKWAMKYREKLPFAKRILCIGATIDFEAGSVKRAHKYIRAIGLEWLFRLFSEPKRLWKRYLVDDLPFAYLVIKQKLGIYRNPFPESPC
jgi:N-acetylglucosaminyldiphosphoundecaprenol N-acetyl-beta-D-mannosaminyltransferase